jgi:LPXTG-motif cell wall-anchored protein
MKALSALILLAGTATFALATVAIVPEIDANSAAAAIALVSGGLLVLRGRRKK